LALDFARKLPVTDTVTVVVIVVIIINGTETNQGREEDRLRWEAVPASGRVRSDPGGERRQRGIQPAPEHSQGSPR